MDAASSFRRVETEEPIFLTSEDGALTQFNGIITTLFYRLILVTEMLNYLC